jgi:integrase/recombinase XerD
LPAKLSTTVSKIRQLPMEENVNLVLKFHEFMKENGASERHQNNNFKAILSFSIYFGQDYLGDLDKKEDFLRFLQSKIKDKEQDPEQKWITTYNDYLHRIKHFYRWLYNGNENSVDISMDLWKTPAFLESLKPKKTKRLSPYSETEIWEKDEFFIYN